MGEGKENLDFKGQVGNLQVVEKEQNLVNSSCQFTQEQWDTEEGLANRLS